MTPHLSLSLLGPLEVRLDDEPLGGFEYNKVRALLAYLAVEARQSHTRASLCALLWPDFSESAARQNLSQALTQLRKVLGDRRVATPFLLTTTERVQLNPEAPWDVDVARFTARVAEAEAHPHRGWHLCTPCVEKLREAAGLQRQPVVPAHAARKSAEGAHSSRREDVPRVAADVLLRSERADTTG